MIKTVSIAAVAFLSMSMLLAGFAQQPPTTPAAQPIPDQYIVVLKEAAALPVIKQQRLSSDRQQKVQLNAVARSTNLAKVKEVQLRRGIPENVVQQSFADAIVGFAAKMSGVQANALKTDPDVLGVYQDAVVPSVPIIVEANKVLSTELQPVTCAVQTAGGPVDGSAKSTWIWILDTGINPHPDLNVQTNALYAKSFIPGETYYDYYGSGTYIAGIAAAKNNMFGVVGVSAGATVVPVKVLDHSGNGTLAFLLAGLNHVSIWATPGDVVNLSLWCYRPVACATAIPPITTAIQALGNAGTSVVMASADWAICAGADKALPGCINGNRLYTVGAINCDKTCASVSNWGSTVVDWAAVGTSVYSTYKSGYATLAGGSWVATAVVSGIIHSKNGDPPLAGGTVNCCGFAYKIAHR